ncbi:hypothetical protein DFH07DRAFT_774575 [Mycena maculata]|uniref:Uncharacterized protein n=1 Tax=Mycena maculata TaxID=230809 RepID=A0AAD7IZS0_9AGAR|nr:hypothetical protein DFH07DRAFT_774575 [Mycena maculata]
MSGYTQRKVSSKGLSASPSRGKRNIESSSPRFQSRLESSLSMKWSSVRIPAMILFKNNSPEPPSTKFGVLEDDHWDLDMDWSQNNHIGSTGLSINRFTSIDRPVTGLVPKPTVRKNHEQGQIARAARGPDGQVRGTIWWSEMHLTPLLISVASVDKYRKFPQQQDSPDTQHSQSQQDGAVTCQAHILSRPRWGADVAWDGGLMTLVPAQDGIPQPRPLSPALTAINVAWNGGAPASTPAAAKACGFDDDGARPRRDSVAAAPPTSSSSGALLAPAFVTRIPGLSLGWPRTLQINILAPARLALPCPPSHQRSSWLYQSGLLLHFACWPG